MPLSSLLTFALAAGLFLSLIGLISCQSDTPTDLKQAALIPRPVSASATGGTFNLKENTGIFVQSTDAAALGVARYLAEKLRPATGFALEVQAADEAPTAGHLLLSLNDDAALGAEGYELTIAKDGIILAAPTPEGLFRGVQTLRQLLPAAIERAQAQPGPWQIATGTIRDFPEYAYRGAMLDVARHFFGVEDVKRYIDLIAVYKMNALHLHLSDDQGWRIEIQSWPNLAIHGGGTEVGGGEGGYYTQDQYREIVQYAQDHYITIVPEIDMPGHTNAALASYADLNCDGKARELYTGTEVGFSTLCTDKEITYQFVNDVIRELAAMTPGPWIHIGGDESHVTPLEDYIPFVDRVQAIVAAHNKQVMGWDEIAHASLVENSVVQYWAKAENAQKGIAQGAKVLMSPAAKTYVDMKYDSTTVLGLVWAGLIEVDTAYTWNPATLEPGIGREHILGIESPLWTETITTMDEIEYMAFPRMAGYAEIGWSPAAGNVWDEYKLRLAQHGPRFEALGIDFYRSPLVPWPTVVASQD